MACCLVASTVVSKRVSTTATGTSIDPSQGLESNEPTAWPASIIARRSLRRACSRAHEPNGEGPHHVTVQLPNGKFETMPYNPAKMRVAEARGHHLDP